MNMVPTLQGSVSAEEWQARIELAYAYRLMDHFGIVDMAHNHLCVRVPGEPDAFLIKPNDAFFDELTASSLEKYDFEGNPRQKGIGRIKGAGPFHAAIFVARPEVNATIHSHSPANMGVASHAHGLLPINQHALHFIGKLNYHDYLGLEADPVLIPHLVKDLGDKNICILRNHGALICGRSLGYAMVAHYKFELACRGQIAALSAGQNITLISESAQATTIKQFDAIEPIIRDGGKNWQGFLRKAERLFPDARL